MSHRHIQSAMITLRKYLLPLFCAAVLFAPATSESATTDRIDLICDIWPPYQIEEADGLSGFSVDLVKEAMHRIGAEMVFMQSYPWKRALLMMEKGSADGLFSANFSPEREKWGRYPNEPLITSPWVIWTRSTLKRNIRSMADLVGLSFGVTRGYSYTKEFWAYLRKTGNYEEASDDETNFRKLERGRIDAVAAELNNGRYIVEKLKIQGVVPHQSFSIKIDGLYLIFSIDRISEKICRAFSDALKEMKEDGTYDRIYRKWLDPAH